MDNVLLLCEYTDLDRHIGKHCQCLRNYLLEKGIKTDSISFGGNETEENHVVKVVLDANNPFNWIMLANNEMKEKGRQIYETKGFDLIHAHDWISAPAGMALAKLTGKPLVLTLHSTENNRGFNKEHSQVVSSIEWWASFEAKRVIVDNLEGYESVKYDLNLPEVKIRIADPLKEGWQEKVLEEYEKALEMSIIG